jgi:hypothetical protein
VEREVLGTPPLQSHSSRDPKQKSPRYNQRAECVCASWARIPGRVVDRLSVFNESFASRPHLRDGESAPQKNLYSAAAGAASVLQRSLGFLENLTAHKTASRVCVRQEFLLSASFSISKKRRLLTVR